MSSKTKIYQARGVALFYIFATLFSIGLIPFNPLGCVVLVEVYEENLASSHGQLEKRKCILIAVLDICGCSLIPHPFQKRQLKRSCSVESAIRSMNLSFSVTVKATALSCILGLLPACDSGMACVGHSENIDSVSYADLHADTFPRMIKKSTH